MDPMTPPLVMGSLNDFPWLYPPKGFYPLDRNGIASIQNVTLAPVTTVLETIDEIGSGAEGWIRLLALESSDFNNSYFSLYEDSQPMKNYVVLNAPIGSTSTPRQAFIPLKGGRKYTLRATLAASQPFLAFRWTLFGWYYQIPQR
jgi:hypothetical protein